MSHDEPAREDVLTRAQARRLAVAAQGLHRPRPSTCGRRRLTAVARRMAVVQIDSVSVLCRSHYLPFFSRLGHYDRAVLDGLSSRPPRALVEYWGHEASLVPPEVHRLLRWRMSRAGSDAWGSYRRIAEEDPALVARVLRAVTDLGASTCADLDRALGSPGAVRGPWGTRSSLVSLAAGYLFWAGEISVTGRDPGFVRRYDLTGRVLPPEVRDAPDPDPAGARRELVSLAARACGVATAPALGDYFRLPAADTAAAVADLVDAGELLPVRIEGVRRPGYLHRDATLPGRCTGRALLSPFDPLVWERRRTQELYDVRLRLEIYTPVAQRRHGYYVLPFLLGDRIVARVDLRTDRRSGTLEVPGAWLEDLPGRGTPDRDTVLAALAEELVLMAGWLGLDRVRAVDHGDLGASLAARLRDR